MASTREPMTAGIEVIRFNASGILDTAFGTGGRVTLPFPDMDCRGIKIMSNGKIMIMGKSNNVIGGAIQLLANGTIDSSFATNGFLTIDLYPLGSDYAAGVLEMQGNRLLFGGGEFDENMKRFSTQSNVPHISASWQNGTVLQTTGTGTYQWYFNGSPVSGSTSDTLNATQNGIYSLQITDDLGCTYMSDTLNLTEVGITDVAGETMDLVVYPNPGGLEFNVKNSTLMNEIKILDMMGKEMFRIQNLKTINHKLQIPNLPAGIYFVEIISGAKTGFAKFIRQ